MHRTLPELAKIVLAEVTSGPVTIDELRRRTGEGRRKIERSVELLRERGHPIMSRVRPPFGLALARSSEEFAPFVKQIYSRQAAMFSHLRSMMKSLNAMEEGEGKQLTFLDELRAA